MRDEQIPIGLEGKHPLMVQTNFKVQPERSPQYLAFIRLQVCVMCKRPDGINSHHVETGGLSSKGSDFKTIPLCFLCHKKVHDKYGKKGPWSIEQLSAMIKGYNEKYEAGQKPINVMARKDDKF